MRGIRGASTALFREGSYSAFFRGLTASLIGTPTLPCLCFRYALLLWGASTSNLFCSCCCNAYPVLTNCCIAKTDTAADSVGTHALSSYGSATCHADMSLSQHFMGVWLLSPCLDRLSKLCCMVAAGIAPYMALELASYDLMPSDVPAFAKGFTAALFATSICYPLDTVRWAGSGSNKHACHCTALRCLLQHGSVIAELHCISVHS